MESERRFPHWLLLCAAVALVLAAVLGFIETVGQHDTLVGRYEQLHEGMSKSDAVAILGPPEDDTAIGFEPGVRIYEWREGPALVQAVLVPEGWNESLTSAQQLLLASAQRPLIVKSHGVYVERPSLLWRARRLAEQAWTAIHGPRR